VNILLKNLYPFTKGIKGSELKPKVLAIGFAIRSLSDPESNNATIVRWPVGEEILAVIWSFFCAMLP
jgi:hypothetical protein